MYIREERNQFWKPAIGKIAYPVIIHLHIQKTGGSTMNSVLAENHPDRLIYSTLYLFSKEATHEAISCKRH